MPPHTVDELREELRGLGYLSRGIERWFSLDPWRSRTFWVELLLVALKAGAIVAPFAAAPLVFVMASRNHAGAGIAATLALLYAVTAMLLVALLFVAIALGLRVRAEAAIENPQILFVLAVLATALVELAAGGWWYAFPQRPSPLEAAATIALLAILFVVSVTVLAAALLSFSIYETRLIPHVRRRQQGALIGGSLMLIAIALLVPLLLPRGDGDAARPEVVATTPTQARVALVAVDGLAAELAATQPALVRQFVTVRRTPFPRGTPPEVWATIGTGTAPALHGVHAVEGLRLAGSATVLQSVSALDFVVRQLAPSLGLASRQPLPPTERRRDYVWELLAARGTSAAAVNWWTSASGRGEPLLVVPQEVVFEQARRTARGSDALGLAVDAAATRELARLALNRPSFVTVYLPALDIVLHRAELEPARRVTLSLEALGRIAALVADLRAAGYDVVLVGAPGEGARQDGVIAVSRALPGMTTPASVAPSLLAIFGFPPSLEMPGRGAGPAIETYGSRHDAARGGERNREYYENLKSLGYIR